MDMRSKVLTGVALASMLLAAACGSDTPPPLGASAPPTSAASIDPAKVTGTVTVLTNRTDLVTDGTMEKYATEFKKTYPDVTVKFEGVTDYEGEVKIRMNTENYGDVLLIPNTIGKEDYPKFFEPLGSAADLDKKYVYTSKSNVGGTIYGIPGFSSVNGFVYNKGVWEKAGIADWPTTPDEFLADLQAIKDKGGAVPYYTNYKDGWPLTAWTSALGSPSCDAKATDNLATDLEPWKAGGDLHIADTLLYNIVNRKLSEADPTTTNWEDSKSQLATGKIATMWLGSWSIVQMQDAAKQAGQDPSVIGYMPFPAQKDGKYCTMVTPDYLYAVNIHSENKPAARAWLEWMVEKSGFAETNQAISSVAGAPLPTALQPYSDAGVEFVELSQAETGKFNKIDNESEVGMNKPDYRQKLIDIARGAGSGDLNGLFSELTTKWADTVKMSG
ncbi:ABC transporter substrate-binding protein [Herbidospora cretacea]|uniref:ABC transporter substrate-binding protein n=1 Tax=Herbidospora cretacea TaxID=28444 RepID=UPI000AB89313|nr:extracellular solute-binding protein [Herbidospora cretacea]